MVSLYYKSVMVYELVDIVGREHMLHELLRGRAILIFRLASRES